MKTEANVIILLSYNIVAINIILLDNARLQVINYNLLSLTDTRNCSTCDASQIIRITSFACGLCILRIIWDLWKEQGQTVHSGRSNLQIRKERDRNRQ